jgi:hypothetical protein
VRNQSLDVTEFLDEDGTRLYQSLIGSAQWVVQLGRFDIAVHVMTLSGFRAQPRHGHMDRIKRLYGYLSKFRHATIRFRTELPDYSDLNVVEYEHQQYEWEGKTVWNKRIHLMMETTTLQKETQALLWCLHLRW